MREIVCLVGALTEEAEKVARKLLGTDISHTRMYEDSGFEYYLVYPTKDGKLEAEFAEELWEEFSEGCSEGADDEPKIIRYDMEEWELVALIDVEE